MPAKEQRTTIGTPTRYYQPAIASLISQAPEITRTDRQYVYEIDPVERGRMTMTPLPQTVPPPSVPPASGYHRPLENTAPPTTSGYATDVAKSRPTPWYRTTKWIAIIIVVVFVVVGVIVGVAVGVSQSSKNKSTPSGRSGGGIQTKSEGQNSPTGTQPMTFSSIAATTSLSSAGANSDGNGNTGNTPTISAIPTSNTR